MANLQGMKTITFGPVPSRRLGRSLGINNIPPKTCTYFCVYCQVGKTTNMTIDRQAFYKPEKLEREYAGELEVFEQLWIIIEQLAWNIRQ
jgi:wyosine [tRNA(Phe)-imidazoG37] synthetase (radical SAM superfamily)